MSYRNVMLSATVVALGLGGAPLVAQAACSPSNQGAATGSGPACEGQQPTTVPGQGTVSGATGAGTGTASGLSPGNAGGGVSNGGASGAGGAAGRSSGK